MRPKNTRSFALVAGLLLSTALAYAASTATPSAQATDIIGAIEGNTDQAKLAADSLSKAKDALKRAGDARHSGDQEHARMLDELALEWASAASDLVRAAELEEKSSKVELEASKLEAKAVRAVAIIEEAVARKGRAEDQLKTQPPAAPGSEKEPQ